MTYKKMYGWDVVSAMLNYRTVYVLDKESKTVTCMNTLPMKEVAYIISDTKENDKRYYFWEEVQE